MAKTVGCVPYVNAAPLVWAFRREGSPVEVLFDVPSRLPSLLAGGTADAILVSSVESLIPGRRVVGGVCIGSFGAVESVRLISKVPLAKVRSVALDQSSMTSNLLAQIVLLEAGSSFSTSVLPPIPSQMLQANDACVLIGDIGMTARIEGTLSTDLGEAWTVSTGLPFVWAMWTGANRLEGELAETLVRGYRETASHPDEWKRMVQHADGKVGWGVAEIERYLRACVRFDLDSLAWDGLVEFARKLRETGLMESALVPERIGNLAPGG